MKMNKNRIGASTDIRILQLGMDRLGGRRYVGSGLWTARSEWGIAGTAAALPRPAQRLGHGTHATARLAVSTDTGFVAALIEDVKTSILESITRVITEDTILKMLSFVFFSFND